VGSEDGEKTPPVNIHEDWVRELFSLRDKEMK
jgi:hypothetical protein